MGKSPVLVVPPATRFVRPSRPPRPPQPETPLLPTRRPSSDRRLTLSLAVAVLSQFCVQFSLKPAPPGEPQSEIPQRLLERHLIPVLPALPATVLRNDSLLVTEPQMEVAKVTAIMINFVPYSAVVKPLKVVANRQSYTLRFSRERPLLMVQVPKLLSNFVPFSELSCLRQQQVILPLLNFSRSSVLERILPQEQAK